MRGAASRGSKDPPPPRSPARPRTRRPATRPRQPPKKASGHPTASSDHDLRNRQTSVQARADLRCTLDLDALCGWFINCELGRGQKAQLVVRLQKRSLLAKLQRDGKVFISGLGSVETVHKVLKAVARRCRQSGNAAVKFKSFKVQGVSWAEPYRLPFCVDLPKLVRHVPGANFREKSNRVVMPRVLVDDTPPADNAPPHPGVQAEVCADGQLRLHGARSADELCRSLELLRPTLEANQRAPRPEKRARDCDVDLVQEPDRPSRGYILWLAQQMLCEQAKVNL